MAHGVVVLVISRVFLFSCERKQFGPSSDGKGFCELMSVEAAGISKKEIEGQLVRSGQPHGARRFTRRKALIGHLHAPKHLSIDLLLMARQHAILAARNTPPHT